MQLKLRDIEVANDDFERQARNTTSSLEDMESKYNQAIERSVMLDEEVKQGEQEREKLRIDSQRLREELSDLKIEAELLQDKLKKQEKNRHHLSTISTDLSVPESPTFDHNEGSPGSTASSPLVTTPPDSKSEATSEVNEPPSPPMSDASAPRPKATTARTPAVPGTAPLRKSRLPSADASATPKPRTKPAPPTVVSRLPGGGRLSAGGSTGQLRTPANRAIKSRAATTHKIPASNSLTHIRTLTAQMQRLEARVHSVRSKLPAPTHTPPRASPRTSVNGGGAVPSTVTMRSRKRTGGSAASSVVGDETTPTNYGPATTSSKPSHVPRLSTSGISRLSFGPLPNRGPESDVSRPSSRASVSSYRPSSRTDMAPPRPMSRSSLSGARTPLGRPRSSMSGSVHGYSASVSRMDLEEEDEGEFRTPSRRGTYSKLDPEGVASSGIPVPGVGSGIPVPGSNRRQSGNGRRTSQSAASKDFNGRASVSGNSSKLADLGETY
jgi:E3 ubiquitin-protein ligase MARCH6